MAIFDHIHHLINEIGPLLELERVDEFAEAKLWMVAIDETDVVEINLDEEEGKLFLAIAVGTPSEESAPRLHGILLRFNYLWEETGGQRMAISDEAGEVVLVYDLPATDLDSLKLQTALLGIHSAARQWREVFEAMANSPGAAPEDLPFGIPFGIRV